jgi:restriction system protein
MIILGILVFGLLTWLTYELIKQKEPSTTFRTFTSTPYQTDEPIHKMLPTVFVEPLKFTPDVTELSISEKLRKIDWFQFEKLIELIYRQRGFTVKRFGGAHTDGGVDLIVQSTTDKFVVQCKQWKKWSIGVRHIREFLGTLTDSKISKGIFITLCGYTGEAKQLADKHEIQILNGSDLVKMLEVSGLKSSKEISALFADTRKFCPKCEKEMVLRTGRLKGTKFWGCSTFPRCSFKLYIETSGNPKTLQRPQLRNF